MPAAPDAARVGAAATCRQHRGLRGWLPESGAASEKWVPAPQASNITTCGTGLPGVGPDPWFHLPGGPRPQNLDDKGHALRKRPKFPWRE